MVVLLQDKNGEEKKNKSSVILYKVREKTDDMKWGGGFLLGCFFLFSVFLNGHQC